MRYGFALTGFMLAAFVATSMSQEFFKGTTARASSTGENLAEAAVNLTLRNTRRYGGYIVHFGMVLLFIGFSGQAFTLETTAEMDLGDTVEARQYVLRLDDVRGARTANYDSSQAVVSVFEDGVLVARMFPERRFYPAGEGQSTSEVSVKSNLREDLYLNFAGTVERPDGQGLLAVMQVFLNPLVMWVWLGGIVVAAGTMIALLPNKKVRTSKPHGTGGSEHVQARDEGNEIPMRESQDTNQNSNDQSTPKEPEVRA
jgi:cytochrome c-type biogenesis protein CcmF